MMDAETKFQSDCASHGLPVEIAVAVRAAIARVADWPTTTITFDTPTEQILYRVGEMRLDGWDDLAFLMAFEDVTGWRLQFDAIRLPRLAPVRLLFWKLRGSKTFGEWCLRVIPQLVAARVGIA